MVSAYLLLSALVVLAVPLYLQRPVAFIAYGGAILINYYVVATPRGMEWFVPILFLKLTLCHLLLEAPFRPEVAKAGKET